MEPKISELDATFEGLLKNEWIPKLLEMCLAVGNYLNGQSARGGAWGFKMENVEKVYEVKAVDNKRNLLMHVIEEIEKKYSIV